MFFNKKEEIINFPKSIEVLGKKFEIKIIFSEKKSSSCSIKNNNKIIFRLSSQLPNKLKKEHFNILFKKIIKKAERLTLKLPQKNITDIIEVGYFEFSQEKYYLERSHNPGVKLKNNNFIINYNLKEELLEKYIIKLLIKKYSKRLETYLLNLNLETYQFVIKGFKLKNLSSKWGHCTHNDEIMINLKLLNANLNILNYVIIHELCHIKHKNHSKYFWNEVSNFCPNYKQVRKYLKENPPNLFK